MTSTTGVVLDSLKGSQEARVRSVPAYASSSGAEVIAVARLAGIELDPWQQRDLTDGLGESSDWKCPECTHRATEAIPCPNHPYADLIHPWAAFEIVEVVPRQNGKDLACSTPILTTDGWKTMGTVEVGDSVYDLDGTPTRVVATSEVFTDHECFEVEFHDGSVIVAGEDHQWRLWDKSGHDAEVWAATRDHRASKGSWRTLSTREVLNLRYAWRRQDTGRMEYRFRVACDAVPQTLEADLPIDPYIFGAWLGDGKSDSVELTVHGDDRPFMHEQLAAAGYEINSEWLHDNPSTWQISFRRGKKWAMKGGLRADLRALGVFGNKHIPECYLTASPAQRLAVLQGLMDTDGSIAVSNKSPQVEFSSSYPAIARDFQRLARSLGIRVTPKRRTTTHRDNWRFLWTPTFNPFRMPRKAERWRAPVSSRHQWMGLVDIRPVETVPTRCIQVEHPEHVYLVGHNFTPTHNSELLVARMLGGLFVLEEPLQIFSAHQFDTAVEIFRRLAFVIENCDELRAEVKHRGGRMTGIKYGHGEEGIELQSGLRVRFKARTGGGGRGFSCNCLYLDEGMILPEAFLGATVPTLSAMPNPQIWLAGSPPDDEDPTHDGVVLAKRRARALAGNDPSLAYFEHSAEADHPAGLSAEFLDDRKQWAIGNPGLGIRITEEHVANERRAMGDRQFAIERLGIGAWPSIEIGGEQKIPLAKWRAKGLVDKKSKVDGPRCLSFDVTPDRSWGAIGLAGNREDGLGHLEIVEHKRGIAWVVDKLVELALIEDPVAIVWDDHSPAAALENRLRTALEDAGVSLETFDGPLLVPIKAADFGQACGMLFDEVEEQTFKHLDQAELAAAFKGAQTRRLGDEGWIWSRKESSVDISTLITATLARWGFMTRQSAPLMPLVAFR